MIWKADHDDQSKTSSLGFHLTVGFMQALLECLAHEADHVEAKLKVLTSTLCFYVDLRIRQDAISPEADAFGHFLFM